MNTVVEEVRGRPVEETGIDNVAEIRGGELLPELDDQPLPADVDVEVVVAEKVSIRVQVREARSAAKALRTLGADRWRSDRWAGVFVVVGFGLIGIAGALALID